MFVGGNSHAKSVITKSFQILKRLSSFIDLLDEEIETIRALIASYDTKIELLERKVSDKASE